MKKVKDMNDDELYIKLDKTRISLGNAFQRANYNAYRKDGEMKYEISDLVYKYNELRLEAKNRDNLWMEYCDNYLMGITHDGFDFLA